MKKRALFDKYDLYERTVQDPPAMGDFLDNVYRETCRRSPKILREDFCGTFALAFDWIQREQKNRAIAVDKDRDPLDYGKFQYWETLSAEDRKRLAVYRKDVRDERLPKADIICALNFSYGVFKKRHELREYLRSCHQKLNPKGIVVLDVLGGCELGQEEIKAEYKEFDYFWQQEIFDPITRRGKFHIHFQRAGEKKRLKVFTYDWRMWTAPELGDLLEEVGFRRHFIYWEGAGRFDDNLVPGSFQSWVAYVVGVK